LPFDSYEGKRVRRRIPEGRRLGSIIDEAGALGEGKAVMHSITAAESPWRGRDWSERMGPLPDIIKFAVKLARVIKFGS